MNNDNRSIVKIGYYILFFILITTKLSIVVLLYGYIHKKNIGTVFDTQLENALTDKNILSINSPSITNIIQPPFIEVYKKNISNETNLLHKYKTYIVSINKIEIFGLQFLAFALFITFMSLINQEYIEDFTNVTSSRIGNLNVLIIVIMLVILFAIVASVYLFIKFMKMRKILSITKKDSNDLQLLKQGLLYIKLDDVIDIIKKGSPNIKLTKIASVFNTKIQEKINKLEPDDPKVPILTNQKFPIDTLSLETLATFYTNNGGDKGNLPAPFNGGDNKYGNIYEKTTQIGTIVSGVSMIVSFISLIVIYKRAE